jgi:hypothetical protein
VNLGERDIRRVGDYAPAHPGLGAQASSGPRGTMRVGLRVLIE